MQIAEKIGDVQLRLQDLGIGGWLLYDFQGINPFASHFLELSSSLMLTRRYFYWIPARGEPVKIVHAIESFLLDGLPGEKKVYSKWQTLFTHLQVILNGQGSVAMEYSPRHAVPYISKVDGGMIDWIRECKVEIVSSAPFLLYYTCILNASQLQSHLDAAAFLERVVEEAWEWIALNLRQGREVSEYDVQQRIAKELERSGYTAEGSPNCSVNEHSANPHYSPSKVSASIIKEGDFILIDLWAKKKEVGSVYADITRVAVADSSATPRQREVFHIVRGASDAALKLLEEHFEEKKELKGCEVDRVCRRVIEDAGYGDFFTHRTGHNIYTSLHGPGTHIDSLETQDERPILPKTCFSIEPGIYLPGEFGIRLETDVYVTEDGKIQVTGGKQDALLTLF